MDFLRRLYQQSLNIWKSLNLRQRIFVGVGFLVVLAAFLYLAFAETAPHYGVLYTNLQQTDAGAIIQKLKDAGISYKLSEDGKTVMVPADRVAETRLTLAQEGLPRGGGVGYEIFEKPRLGITSFEQKVNFKRATEGELARTINQLEEVEWSRVQIAMPEERLFTEQQQEPTASVFLELKPGRTLARKQIESVQRLVASAVERLKPDNVTIVDQYANPLSTPTETALAGTELSASQFDLRSRVEKYFHQKLQGMFDYILGPGKSVVSVSVDLDFDKIETTAEKYDPDSVAVRSEQRQRESSSMPTSQAEGVAGVSANLPSAAPLTQAAYAGPQKQSSSSITNYEVSKTIDHIIKSPSTIKGISVAAVVDGTYKEVTGPGGAVTKEYIPRSDEELEKYKRMVVAAVGAPVAKNVEVINVPLTTPVTEREMAESERVKEKRNLYLMMAKGAAVIVALLVLFFIVRYILKRTLPSRARKAPPTGEAVPPRVDLVTREEADITIGVKKMVEERPEEVASLIKVWLKETK